eukprot:Pgem_evm1s19247
MCNFELFKARLAYDISDNVFGPEKFDIINRNPLFVFFRVSCNNNAQSEYSAM